MEAREVEEAYRRYGHSVLRRARRVLGDEQEAREVLQEIFTALLDRPGQFAGRSAILTFLYSATTHRCLNLLRNQRTRTRILDARAAGSEASGPSLEDQTAAREILGRVPEELARVAIYYYFDELTHAEIAEILECSRRQVGNLLERFKQAAEAKVPT